jgi:hypothetical protein
MPKLNTNTSVVDFLKSTGGDSSFSARANLAVKHGLIQNTSQFRGSASQNTALLNKLRGVANSGSNPSAVASKNDASSFINAKQDTDIKVAQRKDEPETRGTNTADLVDAFKDISGRSSLVPDFRVPDVNFEQTFNKLRGDFNLDQLEQSINEFDAQAEDLRAQLRISTHDELGKPVALNVIEGRVGEQERNMMERIDFIDRQKARAVNQLATANDAIENIMTFKKMDYDVAKDKYDTEFAQNIKLFDTIKGVAEFESSEEDKEQDNARANLQIIYNSISEGGDVSLIDESQKAKINKLELQAGLPQGFYQNIATEKPDAKVLSTTTRTTGGVKYADVLYKNADGSITTQQVRLGASTSGGGKPTESELLRSARSDIAGQLNGRKGADGYVSPEDYKTARSAWVSKGFSSQDFDESFGNEYLNPSDYAAAGYKPF